MTEGDNFAKERLQKNIAQLLFIGANACMRIVHLIVVVPNEYIKIMFF